MKIISTWRIMQAIVCMMLFALPVEAKKVEVAKAESIAQRHLQPKNLLRGASEVRLKNTVKRPASNKSGLRAAQDSLVSYYVFDAGENVPGFIIIAGDDIAKPILGYSDNTRYDENNLPPNFVYWMEGLSSQIADAVAQNIPQDDITKAEWDNLGVPVSSPTLRAAGATSVGALLSTTWGQGKPYNNDCPCHGNVLECLVGNDAAGCVAIAMAQIMKYHRFPTRYNWSSMSNFYAGGLFSNTSSLSKLISDCGVAVNMDYGYNGSGAYDKEVPPALKNTFGYTQHVSAPLRKSDYTLTNWENLLKVDIANGWPVYYCGSGPDGGHAFVCDGYDNSGKFHFNWGWDGLADGYFPLNGLNTTLLYVLTSGNSFNENQRAIINIRPRVDVTGMSLNKTSETLLRNTTSQLSVTFTPSNATETQVTWTSSDNSIATVSSSGLVTTKNIAGTATITATSESLKVLAPGEKPPMGGTPNVKATYSVTVVIPVTGVSINKTSTTIIGINSTETLTATVAPSNATNKAVTWSSSNTGVATVSTAGVVTAKAAGTATITVTTADGSKTATCAVTVTIPVTGVTLNKTSTTIIGINSTETLTATVAPSNATNKAVTWSSSNTGVATVSTAGVVTAKAVGTATITVTTADGSKTATCAVTVTIPVTGVTLNKTSTSIVAGSTETLTATVAPSNATNKTITWGTSNASVATVSTAGVVTAKAAGTATITVTTADGSKTATCTVTVSPVVVTGVSLNKTSTTLSGINSTETLTATVAPSNATNKAVTWSSSNTNAATVSASGVVTTKAVGTATITVTTADGSKTATCTVTVTPAMVTGVSLNKTTTSIIIGSTETLTAAVAPTNATNKAVTWSSSNTNAATVSTGGVVTTKALGTTTITVTTTDGSKKATCTVTVIPKPVSAMMVTTNIVNSGAWYSGVPVILGNASSSNSTGTLNNVGTKANMVLNGLDVHSSSYNYNHAKASEGKDGMLLNTGTVSFSGTNKVRVVKNFLTPGFYFVSFPFDVKISEIENNTTAILGDSLNAPILNSGYWLWKYSGATRAQQGGSSSSWIFMKSGETLNAGETYSIWIDFPGEYTFPAVSVTSLFATDKTKSGLKYEATAFHESHAGWVSVAPMQLSNYYLTDAGGNSNMTFSATGSTKGVAYVHEKGVWVPKNVSGSSTVNDRSVVLAPFTGMLLQISANTNVTFAGAGRTLTKPVSNYYRSSEVEAGGDDTRFDLQLYKEGDADSSDEMAIITTAGASPAYAGGEDGVKQISSSTAPAVYSLVEQTPVALNVVPSLHPEEEIPVGIQIKEGQTGAYNFRMTRFDGYGNKNVEIYLIDKQTGITRLLSPDATYGFNTTAGTFDHRFALRVANSTPTDDKHHLSAQVQIYSADNGVYVKNLTVGDVVSIYNVTGQLISSQVAAATEVFCQLPIQGVYMVKVAGSESVIRKVINK